MYSYSDFTKKAQESGLLGQFSDADLRLAQQNPDAGISLLQYKQDYAGATTPEQKAYFNAQANALRDQAGGYTGGVDGSKYYVTAKENAPEKKVEAYQYTEPKPTYGGSAYSDQVKQRESEVAGQKPFTYSAAPIYGGSEYDDDVSKLAGQLTDRQPFAYDQNADPSYGAYAKQYRREGQRAAADALGQAAAATGGVPSTYAVGAASQAGDYYASKLSDKLPELYQQAYQRYLDEYTLKNSTLGTLNGLAQQDYGKYRDKVGDWQTDRSFDYGKYLDEYQRKQNSLQNAITLEGRDYDRYRDQVGDWQTERNFDYGATLDAYNANTAAAKTEYDEGQDTKKWAYETWAAMGTASPEVAEILGVPVGATTSDQAYRTWQMQYEDKGQAADIEAQNKSLALDQEKLDFSKSQQSVENGFTQQGLDIERDAANSKALSGALTRLQKGTATQADLDLLAANGMEVSDEPAAAAGYDAVLKEILAIYNDKDRDPSTMEVAVATLLKKALETGRLTEPEAGAIINKLGLGG